MPMDGPAQGVTAAVDGYLSKMMIPVTVGGNAVMTELAEMDEIDFGVSAEMLDATSHQSAGWKTQKPGLKSWNGSAKGMHLGTEVTQTALRAALSGGLKLQAVVYPEGVGVGLTVQTGYCYIKDFKFTGSVKDLAKAEFTLEGTGPLSETVQPAEG